MEVLPAPGVNQLIDRFIQGYEGSGITIRPSDGVETLSSSKHIPLSGWYLVALMPTAETFAPVYDLRKRMLLATIILSLLASGLTLLVLKRQLAPVFATIKTLATLSDSDQPPQPLTITRQDEIGELIGGFNRLLESLGQREGALRESEERFSRLANATWEGIIIHREGTIMDANESASKILGCPVEEIIGKNIIDFLAPESIEAASQKLREGTTHDQLYLEVEGLRKDKTVFSAEVLGRSIRYNNTDARVLAIRDITERKQTEEALRDRTAQIEAANKELESFSYSVSHDLRAPLRAIDGYSRMILKKQGEKFDEETRRQFNLIRDNSRAMSRLIDDLMAFSRLGRQVMARSSLAMDSLIREAWQELHILTGQFPDFLSVTIKSVGGVGAPGTTNVIDIIW